MINPKPEHRLTFLEKQFVAMGGHLEGIQVDIETLDQGMKLSFDKIGDAFTLLDSNIEAVKVTIATKDDIAKVETRLDRLESDVTSIKATQEQILQLLQQRPGGEK
jgi:DNA/RNA-binding domain of Phe-tRNA-synthetase-like protein